MKALTKNLMAQLAKIDCSFARYWSEDAASALDWAITNASGKTGRNLAVALQGAGFGNLTGKQEGLVENLAEFDRTGSKALLHILSDGQIKKVQIMAAQKPDLAALTSQFRESPTVATLRQIIQSVEPYCLRTLLPRYNQAAIASVIFERTRDALSLSPSILTQALKAEACYDVWNRK